MIGEHIIVEDLAKLLVGDACHWAIIGVGSSIADQEVDRSKPLLGLRNQRLQSCLVGNARSNRDRALLAIAGVDRLGHRIAGRIDRKSVVSGTSVSVRVDLVGRRYIKKKKNKQK